MGNLTPIEKSLDRGAGNATYEEKRSAYARSAYELTRAIPVHSPEDWTQELLQARRARPAKRAVHIWRLDFA